MGMISDIDEVQKEAASQIKLAEAKKADLKKISAEVEGMSKEISTTVKTVMADLTYAVQMLEAWESAYDSWIDGLKYTNSSFPALKKKCTEIEKFYVQLSDEKKQRDKDLKSGKSKLSPKDAELLDAVFDKAKKNYENYVKSGAAGATQDMLKNIEAELKDQEKNHTALLAEAKRAMTQYQNMMKAMGDRSKYFGLPSKMLDARPEFKAMEQAYDKYFAVFPN